MEYCRHYGNHEAMAMAKSNIEKYYPVVGVLEHMNMSLIVMEEKLPEYFKGALEEFHAASGINYQYTYTVLASSFHFSQT